MTENSVNIAFGREHTAKNVASQLPETLQEKGDGDIVRKRGGGTRMANKRYKTIYVRQKLAGELILRNAY